MNMTDDQKRTLRGEFGRTLAASAQLLAQREALWRQALGVKIMGTDGRLTERMSAVRTLFRWTVRASALDEVVRGHFLVTTVHRPISSCVVSRVGGNTGLCTMQSLLERKLAARPSGWLHACTANHNLSLPNAQFLVGARQECNTLSSLMRTAMRGSRTLLDTCTACMAQTS